MVQLRTNEIIKSLRVEKGLSQKQLAEVLNVAQNTVSNWENGTREPDLPTIRKLAEYFNVSTDFLLGKTGFRNPTDLFEHWSGHNNPFFESPFDFGRLLKEEREAQNISIKEVAEGLGITESDVSDIEDGILPINYEWAEKYANLLGTSVSEIFCSANMDSSLNDIPLELLHHYQEQGLSESEMVIAYTEFKKAQYRDAMEGLNTPKPDKELTDEEILTLAAHRVGYKGDLTEDDLDRIKLAVKIALAKEEAK